MKAFKFTGDTGDYVYTTSFTIELTDDKPRYECDGNPVEIEIPRGFKQYKTMDALIEAIEVSQHVGNICSCAIHKLHGKLITIVTFGSESIVLIIDFSKRGAWKEFIANGHEDHYRNLTWNYHDV